MIIFEEELKKFHPSPEIGDSEEMMNHIDRADITDILIQVLTQNEMLQEE